MRQQPLPQPAFVQKFLATLSPELAASFTPDQLAGVQRAFGLRHGGRHAFDLRRSLWTPWGRFYLVLLAGSERRSDERRALARVLEGLSRLADAMFSAALLGLLLLGALGVVYALKLGLGIDLVPGVDVLPDEALLRDLRGR
jgi:hypothetical protein